MLYSRLYYVKLEQINEAHQREAQSSCRQGVTGHPSKSSLKI